jgi:hypothetical protein
MPSRRGGPARLVLALATSLWVLVPATDGQPRTGSVRLALLSQWVVNQHRAGGGPSGSGEMRPEFRIALDRGVVDRVVFAAEHGAIQRESLVRKPVRVVMGPEAVALGGRGEFEMSALRPDAGVSAWTEVEVGGRSGQPDDVLVLEIGGELSTIAQVLASVFVLDGSGGIAELGLSPSALIRGDGVPVLHARFGQPVGRADARTRGRRTGGVEFLVIRSLVEVLVDAATTPRGPADASPHFAGEWREGDRVVLRVPQSRLAAGPVWIVLGWKDRILLAPLDPGR